MHLADAFIQSDLQLHSGYTFSLVCVFPGNRTHNLLRSWCNALPLSHTGTRVFGGTIKEFIKLKRNKNKWEGWCFWYFKNAQLTNRFTVKKKKPWGDTLLYCKCCKLFLQMCTFCRICDYFSCNLEPWQIQISLLAFLITCVLCVKWL